ncbi:hypothetical protein JB92DRAFT_2756248 [Gautieria morchelliformis]|nr:hypothetical protein JB92DRAFT_2756248 [Gautieria morchelliformis]
MLVVPFASSLAAAQSQIRTDMPVPPLQWLDLTRLTNGASPQPLKDSSIGYDDLTRTLIVFGGESQAGVLSQTTYLLNMDSLTWSMPVSKVPSQGSSPPARSRALGTGDFAVNSRRDFLIYGGKGSGQQALNDVWAYDFQNQFWTDVALAGTPPQARWGALGGIDPASRPSSANNLSNVFNIAGGADSNAPFPSSDMWQLNVTGTLASDLFNIQGVWTNNSLTSPLPGKSEAGGAVISQSQATQTRIAVSGGCGPSVNTTNTNVSCVDPATYVLTVSPSSSITIGQCPAPRLGPVLVPNLNTASGSFVSQTFMLLGTFDSSAWNDSGGLAKGEVAVLDVGAGTWARLLPAGDPGSGNLTFPTPREGAAALSFPSALVGGRAVPASDTIVFGGRDANGSYLNELWLLRAYNGTITQSGSWSGFGDGQLGTGVGASGAGVTVQYQTQCAQQLTPTPTSSSSTRIPGTTSAASPRPTGSPLTSNLSTFDASLAHKVLSPVSLALVLAATFMVRFVSPAADQSPNAAHHPALLYIAAPACVASYAAGVAGFVISFTSTTRLSPSLQRRGGTSPDTLLKTVHGQAGLALFVGLYGLVPILALSLWLARRVTQSPPESPVDDDAQGKTSQDSGPLTGEKDSPIARRPASPAQSAPEATSTASSSVRDRRLRTQSVPGLFPGWTRDRESSENSEPGPSTSSKGFEVMNRPRRASGGMGLYPPRDFAHRPRADLIRSLGDISWLERRRSVGVVGELDYALSQLTHASPRSTSPPVTSRPPTVTMSNRPFVRTPPPQTPSNLDLNVWDILLHTLFHAFLLANCILALVALFTRAPLATFIIFLIWVFGFYLSLLLLAWNGRPRSSLLVTALTRLRTPVHRVEHTSILPGSPMDEHESNVFHAPSPGGGPYVYHQPLWRRAMSPDDDITTSHGGNHTLEPDEPEDDDDDDDDRQRRMEEELERRDVNIVTVPRRKLWITNPS